MHPKRQPAEAAQRPVAPPAGATWSVSRPATIGIIGGMGPDAGVDLAAQFLLACRQWLTTRGLPINDQLYPPHLLIQRPIADRSRAITHGGPDPLEGIVDACRVAIEAGATTLGIACNTAHLWYPQIALASAPARVLHIAEIAAQAVARGGFRRAALMATAVTCASGLYHESMARHGVEVVDMTPAQSEDIQRAIYDGVKAGNYSLARTLADGVARALLEHAECIVMACTELPLALQQAEWLDRRRAIDATAALAFALAQEAFRPCETVA
ncbi:aspartate/glutamate racemase family protein [Trinickia diaoshuihuensis]|uniref:aspartate/glutamate racemase family protein n=1 Tax=Trinickia diaoshuihuensis TaxID=2292265 RepID=UPI000E25561A|nr:amino acid racemase [Trinickia diaoshuihuensis]